MGSFLDRFKRLEIPPERREDWRFLEAELPLPPPLPLAEHPLLVLVNGRALVPQEAAPLQGRPWLLLYDQRHGLVELDPPALLEQRYLQEHQAQLGRVKKRFYDQVPPRVLREPTALEEALQLLRASASAPGPAAGEGSLPAHGLRDVAPLSQPSTLGALVGHARLLRLHGKLYDLLTLPEYVAIFESAIEPRLFERLRGLPPTTTPEELLELIAANLDRLHAKARSPLRNKLSTSRLLVNGVTLLPIYREEAGGLFEVYGQLLEARLKVEALSGGDPGAGR